MTIVERDTTQAADDVRPVVSDERWPMPAQSEIAPLIERYGLQRAGARQPLGDYIRQLWQRRRFVVAFSTATNAVGYSRSFLGQSWQLLSPLLNVGVYFLIFGVLLNTSRGVHNFIAYLTIGVFIFTFCAASINQGSRSIRGNLGLTRALHFPRAVLPASTTLVALLQLMYSMIIMVPIVLITGETPSWKWLTLIPSIAVQAVFCLGLSFVFARIGTKVPDASQTLPFVTRVWMYTSGVLFSVDTFAAKHAPWVKIVLHLNPPNVYLTLARHALLADNPITWYDWPLAIGWAVVLFVVGFIFFWRGEEEYGNA